ncbi:hypothetical protein LR48_Vigan08g001100 [Vigna angularis]|uniref:Uncharacterized protein n=1 Tax=Phaseolus angularis TaxID=3914 RepID=A0A0L9V347_PHAAN|nr:hypothetical protein LR48_Vigan08g001100 [Vigna angularis]
MSKGLISFSCVNHRRSTSSSRSLVASCSRNTFTVHSRSRLVRRRPCFDFARNGTWCIWTLRAAHSSARDKRSTTL